MNSTRAIMCGPAGGRVWKSAAYQGCRLVTCRVAAASASRSARQSGPGASATVTDAFGRAWTADARDGRLSLPVCDTPLFVTCCS
jgi:hypothetical protein